MKTSLLRAAGAFAGVASSVVLFGGVASAQQVTITDTGRDSVNIVKFKDECKVKVINNSNVHIENNNPQSATSGDSDVKNNDDVGSVNTGNASNTSTATFNVSVNNSTPASCSPVTPTPPTGGSGGGETPTVTPTTTVTGGSGGGETLGASTTVQQVAAVPVGGVGAGTGGIEYLGGLLAVTLMSGALATRRLQRSLRA
jgi:hypothetical protein